MATSKEINRRLVANISGEPKQMLKPIFGYEREPLLPIEEACKPLEVILDYELIQNIIVSKMNSKQPRYGLTADEAAAIHLYTMEWDEHENSLYFVLNKTLRLADRTKLRPWFRYLKLFLTGVFKLPPTESQVIWCGVPEDLSASYEKGEEYTWWSLSSCTKSISVLEASNYVGTSGSRTMFSIESSSGKSIQEMSYFQQEDEILLPPGRYLKVVDKFSPAPGLHIIHLREIQPPFPMLADPFDLNNCKQTLPQPAITPPKLIEEKQQESYPPLPSVIPEPFSYPLIVEKKHENNPPPTSVIPKSTSPPPTVEKKQEVKVNAQNEKPPPSEKQLDCDGRACKTCGKCRDWYWSTGWFSSTKAYEKRPDAKCTGSDYLDYGTGRLDYHYYGRYRLSPLCECNDNRK